MHQRVTFRVISEEDQIYPSRRTTRSLIMTASHAAAMILTLSVISGSSVASPAERCAVAFAAAPADSVPRSDSASGRAPSDTTALFKSNVKPATGTGANIDLKTAGSEFLHPHEGPKRVEVKISVEPEAAGDAAITVVQKSRIVTGPGAVTVYNISPDTIGVWRAPLSAALFEGDYEVIASKEGFRKEEKSFEFTALSRNDVSMEIPSLEYLRRMSKTWGTCKWVSGGIAAGAGLASLYYYERIGTYSDRYNVAVNPSDIQSDKNILTSSQKMYRISSAVAFSAIGSFLVTWFIQSLYNE